MNITHTLKGTMTARFLAAVTMVSLLLSAFPASFFVAEAANTDAVGTVTVTVTPRPSVGSGEKITILFAGTGTLNLQGWTVSDVLANEQVKHTFGAITLTDGQMVTICQIAGPGCNYLMDSGASDVWNNGADTLLLKDGSTLIASVSWTSEPPVDAARVASAAVNFAPAACSPQFDVAGPTDIQNIATGDYFNTVNDALADCDTENGDTIELLGNISTDKQITISRPITLDGNGFTISPTFAKPCPTCNDNNASIGITDATNVTVKDLKIDGTAGTDLHGINVYQSTGVTLTDVSIANPKRTGVVVNGSTVTVTNLKTSGSQWHAINAAPGSGVTTPTVLIVNGVSVHSEAAPTPHIFTDDTSKNVTVTDTNNQYEVVYDGPNPQKPTLTAKAWRLKEIEFIACRYNENISTFDEDCVPPEVGQCQNLFTNGSFETPVVETNSLWDTFASVTGWVIEKVSGGAGELELHRGWSGNQAADGLQYAELDGNESTVISQAVTTIPGATYELRYAFAGRHDIAAEQNKLKVSINGSQVAAEGPQNGLSNLLPANWKRTTYEFTATGASTNISFADAGPSNSFGTFLDDAELCLVKEPPKTATVTMCKYDEAGKGLSGWQLALLGSKQGEVNVLSNTSGAVQSLTAVPAGQYVVKASGTYVYRNPNLLSDAAFSTRLPEDAGFATLPYQPWQSSTVYGPTNNYLGLQVNGSLPWGTVFSPSHVYYAPITQASAGNIDFKITDTHYSDNVGAVKAELYTGYTGVTGTDGCVTFTDVPHGTYQVEELLQKDWSNVSGLTQVTVDGPTETFTVVNRDQREVPVATIVAEKIVCDVESALPNWNNTPGGAPKITATTAANFVAASNGVCRLVPDWQFEWALQGVNNPGDTLVGPGGAQWNTFGLTDANGKTNTTLSSQDISGKSSIWVREVLKDGYLGFSHAAKRNNSNDVTAELYCHTDGLNYDNFDKIDGIATNNTYHCVAFNYKLPQPVPQCELVMVSDEETVVVETNRTAVPTYVHDNWAKNILDAIWIWNTEYVEKPNESTTYTFKETFTISNPTEAKLIINADNWYKIRVNGTEVINRNGMNSFAEGHQKTFTTEILSKLISGNNVIEFEVINDEPDSSANKFTNPAGLYYRLEVKGDKDARCEVTTAPRVASLAITSPAVDNAVVPRVAGFNFSATFTDDDDTVDTIEWAIRAGTCEAGVGAIAGNVDGFNNSSTFAGGLFSATLDTSAWAAGNYCFVVNPKEQPGETPDLRATRPFTIPALPIDPPPTTYTIEGYKYVVEDDAEIPTAGWTIRLYDELRESSEPAQVAVTNNSGYYSFTVPAGEWRVEEVMQEDYEQVRVESNIGGAVIEDGYAFCRFDLPYKFIAAAVSDSEPGIPRDIVEGEVSIDSECDFYNEREIVVPPPPTNTNDRNQRSQQGTRVARNAPASLQSVLGAATSVPQCGMYLFDYTRMGQANSEWEVKKLQWFLTGQGFYTPATGVFDKATDTALRAFQLKYQADVLTPWFVAGIVPHQNPTGWMYQLTRWKINNIVCPQSEAYPVLD